MEVINMLMQGNADILTLILHTDTKVVILLILLLLCGPLFH